MPCSIDIWHRPRPLKSVSARELFHDLVGEWQRCSEARGFDAVEIDQARDAVFGGSLHDEIGGRLVAPADLRADPGVAGHERAVAQPRPIVAHRGIERIAPARIDGVIDAIDPFDIGAEARLPGEIEGDVDAEPARYRYRVDQVPERRLAAQREIDPAAEIGRRDAVRR